MVRTPFLGMRSNASICSHPTSTRKDLSSGNAPLAAMENGGERKDVSGVQE